MKIITSIFDLNKEIKDYKNIGFVPTMGGIHAGHISLIKASQNKKNKTIVSIFVNPAQFNKIKDFKNYPRNIKKDIVSLKKLKVEELIATKILWTSVNIRSENIVHMYQSNSFFYFFIFMYT